MLIVIALGGNALLQRGEPLEASILRKNVRLFSESIAKLSEDHQIIICHGNGPQVGLLALTMESYHKVSPYPLDVLDAESQGMIGYLIQQEVGNLTSKPTVSILTQVLVDQADPAFQNPTKPIGPIYTKEEAGKLQAKHQWHMARDVDSFRRVVPSPEPIDIIEIDSIKALLKQGSIVICGGGGGIPVIRNEHDQLDGIEAVVDKDYTAALIAQKLNADQLIILTAVDAVYRYFNTPNQRAIRFAPPEKLEAVFFPVGSMGPKIKASCAFVKKANKIAKIGGLSELLDIVKGKAGTVIDSGETEITYYPKEKS